MAVGFTQITLFIFFLLTFPLYTIILTSIFQHRNKRPFDGAFFKIFISVGLFDLSHLVIDWTFIKFVNFRWFGVDKLVAAAPGPFARVVSIMWWYTAFGEKFSVFLIALNRMCLIGFEWQWSSGFVQTLMYAHWLSPLIPSLPLLVVNFSYVSVNQSQGGMVLFWDKLDWQIVHFCFWWCIILGILCGVCYAITFYKVRQHRINVNLSLNQGYVSNTELKLAVIGFVMSTLTILCGVFCIKLRHIETADQLLSILPYQYVIFDIYASMNPYLLLLCSQPTRRRLKAVICGDSLEELSPIATLIDGRWNLRSIRKMRTFDSRMQLLCSTPGSIGPSNIIDSDSDSKPDIQFSCSEEGSIIQKDSDTDSHPNSVLELSP